MPRPRGDRAYAAKVVRKTDEALALAEFTSTAFVEASEIYSPAMGAMN